MPESKASEPIYNRVFRHEVDGKRRIQIPAAWRPTDDGFQFTLIVWPHPPEGPSLRALPPKKMAELMASLDAIPNEDPSKTVLKRIIGSESAQVTLDKAGRICVPEEMAAAAGIEIKQEVTLVGLLDRFEIWETKRYERIKAADAVMSSSAFTRVQ